MELIIRQITDLLDRADHREEEADRLHAEADDARWDAAELIVQVLNTGGMSTRALAEVLGRSQSLVVQYARVHREYRGVRGTRSFAAFIRLLRVPEEDREDVLAEAEATGKSPVTVADRYQRQRNLTSRQSILPDRAAGGKPLTVEHHLDDDPYDGDVIEEAEEEDGSADLDRFRCHLARERDVINNVERALGVQNTLIGGMTGRPDARADLADELKSLITALDGARHEAEVLLATLAPDRWDESAAQLLGEGTE